MTLQEFYARVGGDYNATLSRLPSEALVKKFILKYPGDPSFAQLKDALAAQDWELALPLVTWGWPSRWKMRAFGRPSLLPTRKCWRQSANCKAPPCRPALQNTMCGVSAAAQETRVPLPCIIKGEPPRSAAHGLLPAAYQYAVGRATGLCHAYQRGGQR